MIKKISKFLDTLQLMFTHSKYGHLFMNIIEKYEDYETFVSMLHHLKMFNLFLIRLIIIWSYEKAGSLCDITVKRSHFSLIKI